jgi:hypothetical protein
MSLTGKIETLTADPALEQRIAEYKQAKRERRIAKKIRENRACGAKTRRGTMCVATALKNGRCRNHGGLNPAPGSPEAKARALKAAATLRRNRDLKAP